MSNDKTDWAALRDLKNAVGSLPPAELSTRDDHESYAGPAGSMHCRHCGCDTRLMSEAAYGATPCVYPNDYRKTLMSSPPVESVNTDRAQLASLGQSAGPPVAGAEGLPLDLDDLRVLERQEREATPAPWVHTTSAMSGKDWGMIRPSMYAAPLAQVCYGGSKDVKADGEFIEVIRNDAKALIEQARRAVDLAAQVLRLEQANADMLWMLRDIEGFLRSHGYDTALTREAIRRGGRIEALVSMRMAERDRLLIAAQERDEIAEAVRAWHEANTTHEGEDALYRRVLELAGVVAPAEAPAAPAGREWLVCSFCVGTFDLARQPSDQQATCPHCGATYDEVELADLEAIADGPDCAPDFDESEASHDR